MSSIVLAFYFPIEGDWKMWVTSAETCENAQVVVVIYGDKGNSGPIILGTSDEAGLFQQNNVDEFKVNLAKVGKLYKIRMELDAMTSKTDPVWKIKEVGVLMFYKITANFGLSIRLCFNFIGFYCR